MHPGGTLITRDGEDVRWWNWADYKANGVVTATLAARLADLDAAQTTLTNPVRFTMLST